MTNLMKATNTTSVLKCLLLGTMALSLSGCGYLFGDKGAFPDVSENYKNAREIEPIRVPEGKNDAALQEIYIIPKVQEGLVLAGDFEVPRPAPLVAGDTQELVRIQKLGTERWALVASAPGQVWPQVRAFFSAAGISVARIDARAGVMETTWVQFEAQPMASRFRTRIEQGVQRGTSELHVLQMNQAGDVQSWPAQSDSVEREGEMLTALAQYIADSSGTAPVSMIAEQGISATGRITVQELPGGEIAILLALPFDRAWASLGKGLEKSTFEITDRDRSKGEYYTVFLGPSAEEEPGWFDWLWGDGDKHPLAGEVFVVNMTAVDTGSVKIQLRPQNSELPYERREEQMLLALLKSNIN